MGRFAGVQLPQEPGQRTKKLIEAAAGAVDKRCAPPQELVLYWDCQRYGALPEAGGVMDQDYHLLRCMASVSNVYQAKAHYRSCIGEQIHGLSNSERAILGALQKDGLL